ncbi:hypothetical protein GF327_01430 [Candidatus Woesearchaeota archaeon]|nr:hypothetical protein [Candidatus Woesearchaeota archaeon]
MTVETIRMSSRGQVVIPQDIRDEFHMKEGTVFAVVGSEDTVILKKISTPSKEELIKELGKIAIKGTKRAKTLGIKESDVPNIVHRIRREKRKR